MVRSEGMPKRGPLPRNWEDPQEVERKLQAASRNHIDRVPATTMFRDPLTKETFYVTYPRRWRYSTLMVEVARYRAHRAIKNHETIDFT